MPLVILEGPDGSGKTTLATRLLKGTGHPLILVKRSGRPANHETLRHQSAWIHSQSETWNLNVICDRHPLISDGIYAKAVRHEESPWTAEQVADVLLDYRDDILVIFCRTIEQRMAKAAHVEQQMEGVHNYYHALVNEYDSWMAFFRGAGLRIVNYDNLVDSDGAAMVDIVRMFWERRLP